MTNFAMVCIPLAGPGCCLWVCPAGVSTLETRNAHAGDSEEVVVTGGKHLLHAATAAVWDAMRMCAGVSGMLSSTGAICTQRGCSGAQTWLVAEAGGCGWLVMGARAAARHEAASSARSSPHSA